MGNRKVVAAALLGAALGLFGCGGGNAAQVDGAASDGLVPEVTDELSDTITLVQQLNDLSDAITTSDEDGDALVGDVRIVGSEEYGYVEVPGSWIEFQDVDGNSSIQWCDGTDKTIISLNRFDLETIPEGERDSFGLEDAAESVWQNMVNEGADEDSITGAHVTLAGFDAVQVYGAYPDGSFLVTWLVDDRSGGIRYVAAEGTADTIMDAVGIVEDTWSL